MSFLETKSPTPLKTPRALPKVAKTGRGKAMEGRILNFNTSVAVVWGRQEAEFRKKGCPMPMPDSFIGATARRDNLTIATRNAGDYNRPGLTVLNPVTSR